MSAPVLNRSEKHLSPSAGLDRWYRQRDALSRQWPSLLRALPQKTLAVRRGGALGLTPSAVALNPDWLNGASVTELNQAMLHLSAHATLGHRPWRWHAAALDAQMNEAAAKLLVRLGVNERDAEWHADHHGTWPDIPIEQPGESLMARSAPSATPQIDSAQPKPAPAASQPPERPDESCAALPDFELTEAAKARPQSQIGLALRTGERTTTPIPHKISPTDWQAVMHIWLTQRAYQQWQFNRPARRQAAPFILPRLGGRRLHIVLAIDISGSIAPEWIAQFLSKIEQLRSQIPLQLRLITCDNRIHRDERLHGITLWAENHGGGGTDFSPVFERLNGDASVDALIYCTDLAGQFPPLAPQFPVFWLVPPVLISHSAGQHSLLRPPPFGHVLTS